MSFYFDEMAVKMPEMLQYPFQAVASVEDDWWQENIEEHFRVKGHLSHKQNWQDHVTVLNQQSEEWKNKFLFKNRCF